MEKKDFLTRLYDKVNDWRQAFELGNALLIVAILTVFFPCLCYTADMEGMKLGMFVMGIISLVVLCFLTVPCVILAEKARDEGKEESKSSFILSRLSALFCLACFAAIITNFFMFTCTHSRLNEF